MSNRDVHKAIMSPETVFFLKTICLLVLFFIFEKYILKAIGWVLTIFS